MVKYLELHAMTAHQVQQVARQPQSNKLIEKLSRPEATLDMTETQWREFMREWAGNKRSTKISGQLLLDTSQVRHGQ